MKKSKNYCRWVVEESYYGKAYINRTIASTNTINDAVYICNAFLMLNHGRPFKYKVTRVDPLYIETYDNPIQENVFTGEKYDFTQFMEGVHCLDKTEK